MRNKFAILIVCSLCWSSVMSCSRSGSGRRCPPRDTTKPTIKCPLDINKVADPFQINTKVYWDEKSISANDDRDGAITPFRSFGKAPGKLFSGTSRITYTAKDKGGNYASCSFYIHVRVIRCPDWGEIPDGWKICYTHDFRRGSTCRFGCYGGHELVGPSKSKCLDSEQWDLATKPVCQRLQCSALWPSSDQYGVVDIACTDSNYYRSKCSYNCADGHSVLPGHSKVRVCDERGNWKGSVPRCVDTEPPTFTNCPYAKTGYAERSKTTGRIWWNNPVATDNSGSVSVIQISGPTSGTELEVGEHIISYMAYDAENNTAVCEFPVVVKQIKCYTIYPLPYTSVVCPNGRIYGSSCEFTCDTGTKLNGSSYTLCDKVDSAFPYGRWSFMDKQPFCTNINSCPDIRPPDNGALACDVWMDGRFCQILCEENFVLSNKESKSNLLVCGDSGTWYGSTTKPHCEEVEERLFDIIKVGVEYNFYKGPCDESREDIKEKFLEAFNKGLGPACKPTQCHVNNVKIICGARSDESREKRSSEDAKISFEVKIELSNDLSPENKLISRGSIKESITTATNNGDLNLDIDGYSTESPTVSVSQISGECSTGSAYNKNEMQCVKCNAGYYHDIENDVCSTCERGFYQDLPQQSSCKQCPHGKTTKTEGANSDTECEEACQPGFYSSTGTPLCSACDIGYYSEKYGSVNCTKCKGSQITLKSGSTHESNCTEFDIAYNPLNESEVPAVASLDTQASNLDQFIVDVFVKCSQCDNVMKVIGTDNTDLTVTHTDNLIVGYNGQQYTTGKSISGSMMWTQVTVVNSGTELITYIDGVEAHRVQISSRKRRSLDTQVNVTVTLGGEGFLGSISQLNVWSDASTFTPEVTNTCFKTDQGDLIKWSDFAELDGSFVFSRSKCDVDNSCESSPCHNGGSCIDSIGSFSCTCVRGFNGNLCEVNIDDCLDNACDNNATCVDGNDEYTCVCPQGFSGQYCETLVVDGGWTEFEISGECSVTCGNGTQQKSRACENPRPLNGGKNCEGSSTEMIPCVTNVTCINECGQIPTNLTNGNMNCGEIINGTRICKPTCNAGYEFDSDLFVNSSGIACGPETGYVWNIKNEDNPEGQIPACQPKHLAPKLTANQSGVYNTLSADASNVATSIKSTIGDKLKTVGCVSNGTCELKDVHVGALDEPEERKRRATSYVTFTIELSCDNSIGKNRCYDLLAEIVRAFNTFVQNLAFTIQYGGVDYDVDANSTFLDGLAECEPGYASVWEYCVSCGKGTYSTNDYCESCPRGYYQDEEAQISCKKCPDGWTTAGLMSRDSRYCNIEKSTDDITTINLILIIVISIPALVATAIIISVIVCKCKNSKKNKTCADNPAIEGTRDHMSNANQTFPLRRLGRPVEPFYDNTGDTGGAYYINPPFSGELKDVLEKKKSSLAENYKRVNVNPIYTDKNEECLHEISDGELPASPPPAYENHAFD